MDTRYLGFVDADRDFYELVWNVPPTEILAAGLSTEGVQVSTSGPFRIFHSGRDLPPTGWKVHVSCRPERAEDVVTRAVSICLDQGITCKHLMTRRLVAMNQAKYADPEAAGKVITAYPADAGELERLVATLCRELAGEPGGRALSDIPVSGAPVSIRRGAFIAAYHLDDQGRVRAGQLSEDGVVSDPRAPHTCTATDDEPSFVRALREEAARRDRGSVLDVSDVRVLHRSNAGGVYAATWADGRPVVLKEARHHTGFDRGECDAVTRLRQEESALGRLAGTGITPALVGYVTTHDSDFLVMERLEGQPLTRVMATNHPGAVLGADGVAYRRWVDEKATQLRRAIEVLHRHGVVHLDLQPANILDCGNHVRLIDLESCAIDGRAVADGVATELSHSGDDLSPQADHRAVDRLVSSMLCPTFSLTVKRPELAVEMLNAAHHDLSGTLPSPSPGPSAERLVAGLHLSATPQRTDRLFPGDIAAFATPGGGAGLMHGAAGILHALQVTGHPVPPEWRRWLLDRIGDTAILPGLADGRDGMALVLLGIEDAEAALRALPSATARNSPWWGGGLAGSALARAIIGAEAGESRLMEQALSMITSALDAPSDHPGHCAGLLQGWTGVGLAALRIAEIAEASGTVIDTARFATRARQMFDREMAYECRSGATLLTRAGGKGMPYIGRGSAALGLLAAALESHGVGDEVTHRTRDGVVDTVRARCVGCAGLLHGRTGQLLVLATLQVGDEAIAMHQTRLRWHAVPAALSSRRGVPGAERADFYLGDQNLRSSADLATGAAGVLLASTSDPRTLRRNLLEALFLPRSLATPATASPRDDRSHPQVLTTATTHGDDAGQE